MPKLPASKSKTLPRIKTDNTDQGKIGVIARDRVIWRLENQEFTADEQYGNPTLRKIREGWGTRHPAIRKANVNETYET